jgi:hypothetical protein
MINKTQNNWRRSWRVLSISAVIALAVGFIYWPHKTKDIEAHTTLQSGQTFSVLMTLRSPWGWQDPDCLERMQVLLNGKNIPIDPPACRGINHIRSTQPPIIVEKGGFPEVIVLGKPGSFLKQANWLFLNYSLSSRELITTANRFVSNYAMEKLTGQSVQPKQVPVQTVTKATISKAIPISKLQNPTSYNGLIHVVALTTTTQSDHPGTGK